MNESQQKSWFKQAWPWFVISIPLLTMVAGIMTYYIAVNDPNSMVEDDYFKQGLAINQSLAKLEQAKAMQLDAVITVDTQADLISLHFNSNPPAAQQLTLVFSHPTRQDLDHTVILEQLSSNEYVGQLPQLPETYWYIRLFDNSESWVLKNRWHYPQDKNLHITYQ